MRNAATVKYMPITMIGMLVLEMARPWGGRIGRKAAAIATVMTIAAAGGIGIGTGIVVSGGGGGGNLANEWVDFNGGTCTRQSVAGAYNDAAACGGWSAAYLLANQGDVVRVRSAAYAATDPSEGAYKINADAGKTGSADVSFLCDNGAVTFASPTDQVVVFAKHLTIQGSCFNFQHLWIGGAPYSQYTDDVTIDGVNMEAFEVTGSTNITIQNSEIGPSIACLAPGNGAASCQNNSATGEDYWFNRGVANISYPEPKIHNGDCCTNPSNVVIQYNHFYEIQTRDAAAAHTGCLWLGWGGAASPIIIRGNVFERCAIYDIHIDGGGNNVQVENNFFGYSVEPLANTGQTGFDTETNQEDIQCKAGVCNPLDWLIRFNTFSHGVNMNFGGGGSGATNVRLIGNYLGNNTNCGYSGQTIDYNVVPSGTCGTNSTTATASSAFLSTSYPFNFHLTGSPGSTNLDNFVTPTGSDYSLTIDKDGQSRTAGSRDAGADER